MTFAKARGTALTIGALAERTRSKAETIRYYERIGLLPRPARSAGNQRLYTERDAARLAFIRHGRELGFPLDAIRQLLALCDRPDHPCGEADRIAGRQLDAVRSRIARLRALESELERMVSTCRQGRIAECRVIEVLADHNRCLADHGGRAEQGWD